MPVLVPSTSTYAVSGQVNLVSQPQTQQANFRQMLGEVQQWNPDAPPTMVAKWLQNSYRRVVDSRQWYGMMVKGQLTTPQIYTTGNVAVVNGSATVNGSGVAWDATFIGRQFRTGFQNPIYTIIDVPTPTSLTLEMPFAGVSSASAGYSIFKSLVSLGYNVKSVVSMVNLNLNQRMWTDLPAKILDAQDPWRSSIGFTKFLFQDVPSSAGEPICELYPAPITATAFPFRANIQPPDLSDDNPFVMAFVRTDVIVLGALPDALLFRGKQNQYYDPATAAWKERQFQMELMKMAQADDSLYMKDLIWEYDSYPMAAGGYDWAQSHDV